MSIDTLPASNSFIPINKQLLMNFYDDITFDIYTYPPGKQNLKEPVLLVRNNSTTSTIQELIAGRGFEHFFIKTEDKHNFNYLLEDSISHIVKDSNLPLAYKSKIIYDCASNVMKDIFSDPRSGEKLKRVENITENVISFILNNESSTSSLLQLSSHDYYTFAHCLNVAVLSIGMWHQIYPDDTEDLQSFALGCILHDIGKSKIDSEILNKPGPLTDEEFTIIKKHPQYGYDLMAGHVPPISLDVILNHHEKQSGLGYPKGIKGEQISDFSKIAAIADVYDALTTRRPYDEARDPYTAMLTMKDEMEGHFEDKKLISFVQLLGGNKVHKHTNST